jgi:hypothetical protein
MTVMLFIAAVDSSSHNCPIIWKFYACSPDVKPEGNAAGNNWHIDLYDGKELLEDLITRSKTLKFSFSTKELEDEEEEFIFSCFPVPSMYSL